MSARNDTDFDTWFLLRLAEFVLRCRGVDFKWRNDAPVLEDRYNVVKNNRASARAFDRWQSRSMSVFGGDGTDSQRRRAADIREREREAGLVE